MSAKIMRSKLVFAGKTISYVWASCFAALKRTANSLSMESLVSLEKNG